MYEAAHPRNIRLGSGEFRRRFDLNVAYLKQLETKNLLQNHYMEAALWGPSGKPEDCHWGWESPSSQVRGHFLGHWMSGVARTTMMTGDEELAGKLRFVVAELARCQERNGGEWVASIPEKYLSLVLAGHTVWAPSYVAHKTLMGLHDTFAMTGNEQALEVLLNAARWFHRWTGGLSRDELDDLFTWEVGGMLELWSNLAAITGDQHHFDLVERYDKPRQWDRLLAGEDILSNQHANNTIPEVLGAARAWEVTGDQRWRDIVEAYWRCAVDDRESFASGGQNTNEHWVPPGALAARLADNNQEHCTVFHMMRLAEYLFRWTGESRYADYWERNLWNGVLAQQHPVTGMVAYFLPMRSGARKQWSRPLDAFFCCSGTLVQAGAHHTAGAWFVREREVVVAQYVQSAFEWDGPEGRVTVTQSDEYPFQPGRFDLDRPRDLRRPNRDDWAVKVRAEAPSQFVLTLRVPWWVEGPVGVTVDGKPLETVPSDGFVRIDRTWTDSTVVLSLPRSLRAEPLPGEADRVAFLDGPVLLAALGDPERLDISGPEQLVPDNERHFAEWAASWRATSNGRDVRLVPLCSITDDDYTVYVPIRSR